MKKYEGKKPSLTKLVTQKNLSTTNSQFPSTQNSILEDKLINYINELSSLINQFYKLNHPNFVNIKNILNKPMQIQNSQKELIRLDSQPNKNILHSFQKIENTFSSFCSEAKDIFHKLRVYQNEINENAKKNKESINKIMVTNNNINISNSIIHNDSSYNKISNDLKDNIRLKFEKYRNDSIESKKNIKLMTSSNYLNPYNNYLNNSNKLNNQKVYLNTYESYANTETLNESDDDQINNINIEKEEYKKTLNKFSKDVYHFLNSVQQLQRNVFNSRNFEENWKISFERERNILTQTCLKYLSNTNPKISLTDNSSLRKKSKTRNYLTEPNSNCEVVKIESEYDKLRNDFDNLNKKYFVTQIENQELKNEVDKLRKNLTCEEIIKLNINNNKKKNNNHKNIIMKSPDSSFNSFENEEDYKKYYKIVKNENKNMKGIITTLSTEIAEMKKKNYEFSPSNNKLNNTENKNDYSYSATPKKKIGISLFSDNKNDLLEKIKNLTLKNNEMGNQIKEMNVQRNNCLNILKQNEIQIKEQQIIIEKYIKENEKLKCQKNPKYNNSDFEETIILLESNNKKLKNDNENLNNEIKILKNN